MYHLQIISSIFLKMKMELTLVRYAIDTDLK